MSDELQNDTPVETSREIPIELVEDTPVETEPSTADAIDAIAEEIIDEETGSADAALTPIEEIAPDVHETADIHGIVNIPEVVNIVEEKPLEGVFYGDFRRDR